MKTKKTRRGTGIHNGATHFRIILADPKFRNKFHVYFLRGSILGAVLAILVGVLHMDTSILEGIVIAGTGMVWLGVFYLANPDDEMFGG